MDEKTIQLITDLKSDIDELRKVVNILKEQQKKHTLLIQRLTTEHQNNVIRVVELNKIVSDLRSELNTTKNYQAEGWKF